MGTGPTSSHGANRPFPAVHAATLWQEHSFVPAVLLCTFETPRAEQCKLRAERTAAAWSNARAEQCTARRFHSAFPFPRAAGRWAGSPWGLLNLWVLRGQRAQQCSLAALSTWGLLWSCGTACSDGGTWPGVGNSSEQLTGGWGCLGRGGGAQPEQHR